jgi:hypothetical protein
MSYVIQYRTLVRAGNRKWRTIGPFTYPTREAAVKGAALMFPQGYSHDCVRFRSTSKEG